MASEDSRIREIKDENGYLLYRVVEENPGTAFASLRCESRSEVRRVYGIPERWHRLSDRKLYALCKAGDLISEEGDEPSASEEGDA